MRSLLLGSVTSFTVLSGCSLFEDATTIDVDYDVELVEPVVFDGSQAVEPSVLSVSVSSSTPTQELSLSRAGKWGPMLAANQIAVASGQDQIFTIRNAGITPTFTGSAPVTFVIDVSSADGTVWGDTLNPEPEDVPSCTFTLDPATAQTDDFGIAVEGCLVDWADTNGIPSQLQLAVSTSTVAAAHGPTPDYEFVSEWEMSTNEPFEIDCEVDVALPDSVTDRLDTIEFDGIQLDAVGTADDPVFVSWFGFIFDSNGLAVADGFGAEAMAGGDSRDYHAVVAAAGEDAVVSGNANVNLSPEDPADFLQATINALAGLETGSPGGGMACWFSFGATPRSGTLEVIVSGVAQAGLQ